MRRAFALALLVAVSVSMSLSSASAQDAPPPQPQPPAPPPQPPAPTAPRDVERARALRALVWDTVDSPDAAYPVALAELSAFAGVTWSEVAAVLRAGRDYSVRPAPPPPSGDMEACSAYFAAFPWEMGKVRRYPLGTDSQYWYGVELPPDYDGTRAVPVWFDFGLFAEGAPPGFARVRIHDFIPASFTLGKAPVSMTAGFAVQSIVLSVTADLERRFHVDRDRVFCGGFSRFGNTALYEGLHWPDLWAGIVPAAGYYDFDDALLPNLEHVAVLAAHGTDKGHRAANDCTARLARRLATARHRDVTQHAAAGRAIDGLGPVFLAWIAERRRTALPRAFTYVLHDPRHRGAYWLEILSVKATGALRTVVIGAPGDDSAERFTTHAIPSSATVEVTGPNEVRVRTTNVAELRLYLSPDVFDLTRPLRITSGGRTVERVPRPEIGTLVRNFRRDGDRGRLFPAEVVVRG